MEIEEKNTPINKKEYIKQIERLIFDISPNFESFNFKKENLDTNLINNETGIIIDNGSYECRAGWSICKEPNIRFRSLVAKPKLNDSTISSLNLNKEKFIKNHHLKKILLLILVHKNIFLIIFLQI